MTNTKALENKIHESGITYSFIADKLGISYQALRNKMDNKSEFKAGEIKIISELIGIKSLKEQQIIFFSLKVD